jgi:hypothetical protein
MINKVKPAPNVSVMIVARLVSPLAAGSVTIDAGQL